MPDTHVALDVVSDEVLARRIAVGERGTTEPEEAELYRRYAPRVRMYGRRHLRNEAASEDLAQEVLLCTIDRLRAGEVRRPEEIGSFILGTSRMMALSERRIERRRSALVTRFTDPVANVVPTSTPALDASRVSACLRTLPERDRQVVLLTFYAEQPAPQIAEELGITSGAVRAIRHRAMVRLRTCVLGGTRP